MSAQQTFSPVDFGEIHAVIQEVFATLIQHVQQTHPSINARTGRTSTQRFPLFSYVTLGADATADPVVVGINVEPGTDNVQITGDVCREQSGVVLFEAATKQPELTRSEVIEASRAVAAELAAYLDAIVTQVFGNERPSANGHLQP